MTEALLNWPFGGTEYQYEEVTESEHSDLASFLMNSAPGYEVCPEAEMPAIHKRNGGIVIRLRRYGCKDYWYSILWDV